MEREVRWAMMRRIARCRSRSQTSDSMISREGGVAVAPVVRCVCGRRARQSVAPIFHCCHRDRPKIAVAQRRRFHASAEPIAIDGGDVKSPQSTDAPCVGTFCLYTQVGVVVGAVCLSPRSGSVGSEHGELIFHTLYVGSHAAGAAAPPPSACQNPR